MFVKLASYVKKEVNSGKPLIKLTELHSLYESRLEDLGNAKSVNKTRLKERLLEYFKEAQEQFDGRNTFLVFKEGMRNMIQDALKKRLLRRHTNFGQGCFYNKERHFGVKTRHCHQVSRPSFP